MSKPIFFEMKSKSNNINKTNPLFQINQAERKNYYLK